jgi:hypothetical protein
MTEKAVSTQPVSSVSPVNNPGIPWGMVFMTIIIAGLSGVVGYLLGQQNSNSIKNQNTEVANVQPTIAAVTPFPTQEITPVPSLIVNATGNTYTSAKFGIAFDYANVWAGGTQKENFTVNEIGDKIYLDFGNTKPGTGQYIEVFNKNPSDDLETAITKQFLSGISKSDCFIKSVLTNSYYKFPATYQGATIAYPIPTGSDNPPFTFGDKCPEMYKETNGVSFFLMDTVHPSKFIFLSIGQNGGAASTTAKNAPEWFKTIRFIN